MKNTKPHNPLIHRTAKAAGDAFRWPRKKVNIDIMCIIMYSNVHYEGGIP